MKAAVIVNPGLENLAQQELAESWQVESVIEGSVLIFEIEAKKVKELTKLQSIRRIVLPFGTVIKDKVVLDQKFKFKDQVKHYLKNNTLKEHSKTETEELKLKIEVENVKGQENRIKISKKIAEELFPFLEKSKIKAKIDYKQPEVLIIAHNTGSQIIISLDYIGKELDRREYRLFPQSASFKGDLAYYILRKSGYRKNERLLVGFCKDGAIAIEAALYSLQGSSQGNGSQGTIEAFDLNTANVIAARKNAKIAKVQLNINKYSLEDLDLKYGQGFFNRLIFQVTRKDEEQLTELYYQANQILAPKGTLLLLGRKTWEISISDRFKLLAEEEFARGESVHKLVLLEKKSGSKKESKK